MSIACVLLQKKLTLSNREDALREQQSVLEELADAHSGEAFIAIGGLLKTINSPIGEGEGVAASVLGTIENAEHLVKRYLGENFCQNVASPTVPENAEVICHLYKVFGRVLPQKLRGDFCFLLFDPSQGRVLAAVSPTWKAPLLQARGADGSLIITSSSHLDLPPGAHSLLLIPPGSLKYGWSSDPAEYALPAPPRRDPGTPRRDVNAPRDPVTPRGQTASFTRAASSAAATRAFSAAAEPGASEESVNSVQTSDQSFADTEGGEPRSPAPKKTRRGKRAGKNQKLRAEQLSMKLSSEGSMPSSDLQRLVSLQSMNSSFTSRADEQNWWRTDTPRHSLDLSSLSGGAASLPLPMRRASMSATAPPFVPSNNPGFSRQSVPPVRSRTSALDFPAPPSQGPSCPDAHASVVVSGHSMSQLPYKQWPVASPFQEIPGSGAGKADAAWNEEHPPLPAPSDRHLAAALRSESILLDAVSDQISGSDSAAARSGKEGSKPGSPVSLPRLVTHGGLGKGPRGSSSMGASPGGSPHKPPRPPGRGALKNFFKAITSKRPSQVDLRADAGTDAALIKSRARSASHGNLLGLGVGGAYREFPSSGQASGPESPSSLTSTASRRSTKHGQSSRDHEEALMLSNLKISEQSEGHHAPAAESWLARTTRSIFSKSKSCTDLKEFETPPSTHPKLVS